MNFDDTPREAAFRAEVRAWIDAHAPRELEGELAAEAKRATSTVHAPHLGNCDPVVASRDWQSAKQKGGWACLHWPGEHGGRGASPMERVIWLQEEGVYAQLSHIFAVGHGMAGPTLMVHGTEAQKSRYLPPITSGAELWCQLFSEPAAGSDLAGLRTRAEADGSGYVVNGQKIWTTHAQIADFGLLLARTDPTVPKHQGMSMFVLDMRSPGVEVRPIRQMTGEATFNEVFLSDVRIPNDGMIGRAGEGWRIALTTLMNERLMLAVAIPTGVDELVEFCCTFETERGPAIDDPAVRARIATWAARASGLRYTMLRSISALSAGKVPGPENSIGKVVSGEMMQDIAAFALDLQGAAGAVVLPDQTASRFQKMLLSSPSIRIGGGTAEIQKNIIAERILGLPPDIRVDKDAPFNAPKPGGRPAGA